MIHPEDSFIAMARKDVMNRPCHPFGIRIIPQVGKHCPVSGLFSVDWMFDCGANDERLDVVFRDLFEVPVPAVDVGCDHIVLAGDN